MPSGTQSSSYPGIYWNHIVFQPFVSSLAKLFAKTPEARFPVLMWSGVAGFRCFGLNLCVYLYFIITILRVEEYFPERIR